MKTSVFANVLVAMRCNEIFMRFEVHGVNLAQFLSMFKSTG